MSSPQPPSTSSNIPLIRAKDASDYVGQEVQLHGWVYSKRIHGKLGFIILRDGSAFLQIAIRKNNVGDNAFDAFKSIYREASVVVQGIIKEDSRAPGGYELAATQFTVLHPSHPDIDQEVQPDSSVEIMLDKRHLVIRGERSSAILKVRSKLLQYFREFFQQRDVYEVTPPTIVSTFCEGGSDLFEVNYFGKKVFLTQSSQLYLESAIFALDKVFCILPSYRAEKSRTRRHLTEFTHLEVELAFADFEANLDFMEDMIIYVIRRAREELKEFMEQFQVWDLRTVPSKPFMRMTYEEAVQWLTSQGIELGKDGDITDLHERKLTEHFGQPIFLTHFPVGIKPFYHKRDPTNPSVTLSADLLLPTLGEVIGSGERETDLDSMLERMRRENVPLKEYYWYTDLRKYGSVPHSGFGLGVERFVQWFLNLEHIRDTTLYPRTINRVSP